MGSLLSLSCPVFLFAVQALSFCHVIVQQEGPCQIRSLIMNYLASSTKSRTCVYCLWAPSVALCYNNTEQTEYLFPVPQTRLCLGRPILDLMASLARAVLALRPSKGLYPEVHSPAGISWLADSGQIFLASLADSSAFWLGEHSCSWPLPWYLQSTVSRIAPLTINELGLGQPTVAWTGL